MLASATSAMPTTEHAVPTKCSALGLRASSRWQARPSASSRAHCGVGPLAKSRSAGLAAMHTRTQPVHCPSPCPLHYPHLRLRMMAAKIRAKSSSEAPRSIW